MDDPLDEEVAELFKTDPEAADEKGKCFFLSGIARQWTLDYANE